MFIAPSFLRSQVLSTTRAPILAMTASAKSKGRTHDKREVEEIKKICGIQFSDTTAKVAIHYHLKELALFIFYGEYISKTLCLI